MTCSFVEGDSNYVELRQTLLRVDLVVSNFHELYLGFVLVLSTCDLGCSFDCIGGVICDQDCVLAIVIWH